MAFEFFFGLCGLLSCDSKSRHKLRLDSDWRLFTPLGAGLLRDSQKTSLSGLNSPAGFKGPSDFQRPIFSTSGTLAAAKNSGKLSQIDVVVEKDRRERRQQTKPEA